ncbi:MAG: hypothetical protein U0841_05560 [Chloroflexia bacterium]
MAFREAGGGGGSRRLRRGQRPASYSALGTRHSALLLLALALVVVVLGAAAWGSVRIPLGTIVRMVALRLPAGGGRGGLVNVVRSIISRSGCRA